VIIASRFLTVAMTSAGGSLLGANTRWAGERRARHFEARSHTTRSATVSPEENCDPVVLVAVLCGGPTAERGVSLNSARSVLDHLRAPGVQVECYYLDQGLRAFPISVRQMYSNTPSDFDFKLRNDGNPLLDPAALAAHLRAQGAIAFPALHGAFGEDGTLQAALAKAGVPFVGTGAIEAARAFDKYTCSIALAENGFSTLPVALLLASPTQQTHRGTVHAWFKKQGLDPALDWVVVKPARGGSSIGVNVVLGADQAVEIAAELLASGMDKRVVVERYAGSGQEFTIIVLGTRDGPVPLIPTEIELTATDEGSFGGIKDGGDGGDDDGLLPEQRNIFNFRRKYLPTRQVVYHTPARFGAKAVERIRISAAKAFTCLGLRDFARLDGFFMPNGDAAVDWRVSTLAEVPPTAPAEGQPVFTDVNIISGMEQTSFVFLQAAEVGLTHADVLRHILDTACHRVDISLPSPTQSNGLLLATAGVTGPLELDGAQRKSGLGGDMKVKEHIVQRGVTYGNLRNDYARKCRRVRVYVLFGGGTSERQVSLISGTNVWLKLRTLPEFEVFPLLVCPTPIGDELGDTLVWHLPYAVVLRHTAEEILAVAKAPPEPTPNVLARVVRAELRAHGWVSDGEGGDAAPGQARADTIAGLAATAAMEGAVVFNAVHGGCGEDGSLQALLAAAGVAFTGSGAAASQLCIDKAATGAALTALLPSGLCSCPKQIMPTTLLNAISADVTTVATAWDELMAAVAPASSGLCIKPNSDGCSTGVARLLGSADLSAYASAVTSHRSRLNSGDLPLATGGHRVVELPHRTPLTFLVEPFIATGTVCIQCDASGAEGLAVEGTCNTRWVEVTVGVVGPKRQMIALDPSLTVAASGEILSLEDKFQGGTGVNITPPPPSIILPRVLAASRQRVAHAANALGIEGLARIDAFLHVDTGDVMIIEANTVPGMTPANVLFHQALAMDPPMEPAAFLAHAVQLALGSTKRD